MEKAIFCGGCFWCIEAVFKRIDGVNNVMSGYTGGFIKNPSYREVCKGITGHAEGVIIDFDSNIVSYKDLLEVFFAVHNPTTLNRQGNDVGTQYRSAIFYSNEKQKIIAEQTIIQIDSSNIFESPLVTSVEEFKTFFEAEIEHNDYYDLNKNQPYCQFIISPKIKLIKKLFEDKLK